MASALIQAQAPGKLFLSGEHAVVYGRPGLVMACDQYATVVLRRRADDGLRIDLPDFGEIFAWSAEERDATADRILHAHQQFLDGAIRIDKVLLHPGELLLMGLHHAGRAFGSDRAFDVSVESELPAGAGLGSSAAILVALCAALCADTEQELDPHQIAAVATEVEQYQHGRSSGADPTVSALGGLIRFQQEQSPKRLTTPPLALQTVFTGTPRSTTGECVAAVRARCGSATRLWQDFAEVTDRFQAAVLGGNEMGLHQAIRHNHDLLVDIGVVPRVIGEFAKQARTEGASVKICGAGAINGDAAGMALLYADGPRPELCRAFGFEARECRVDERGVHVDH